MVQLLEPEKASERQMAVAQVAPNATVGFVALPVSMPNHVVPESAAELNPDGPNWIL